MICCDDAIRSIEFRPQPVNLTAQYFLQTFKRIMNLSLSLTDGETAAVSMSPYEKLSLLTWKGLGSRVHLPINPMFVQLLIFFDGHLS